MTKKVNLILSVCFMIGAALTTSCQEKDDAKTSKKDMLVGKKWKETARTISPAFAGVTDQYATDAACDKDDFVQFNADGTFINDEGATKCDPGDPQTIQGTWSFNGDETTITATGNGVTSVSTILELTPTQFKHSTSFSYDGTTFTVVFTNSAQ